MFFDYKLTQNKTVTVRISVPVCCLKLNILP